MKRHFDRLLLQRELFDRYSLLNSQFEDEQRKIGQAIPVGGAHMDLFFRAEGVHGLLTGFRDGLSVTDALAAGKSRAKAAVKNWNARREWQVHRWEDCTNHFLETLLWHLLECVEIPF